MGAGRPDDSWQIAPETLNNLLINNVTFSKNIFEQLRWRLLVLGYNRKILNQFS